MPDSYEWRIEEGVVQLFKHELAQTHEFDFVTYATDVWPRFNFLSRWDNTTHHSFAYTRPNASLSSQHKDSARDVFPMDEFKYQEQTLMRGHCIDFPDTGGLSRYSRVKKGTMIEFISTLDPRNYIPEPRLPSPYWGETVRKELRDIRAQNECYAQYMYYWPGELRRTTDKTATLIPEGIYFVRTGRDASIPCTSYHIPWSGHAIHEESNELHWTKRLEAAISPNNFFSTPFVHSVTEKDAGRNRTHLGRSFFPCRGTYEDYNRIVKIADHEVGNITGKAAVICFLLSQPSYDSRYIHSWMQRLIEHVRLIHEKGSYGFMKNSINHIRALPAFRAFDRDGIFEDWLKQLWQNDQEEAPGGRGAETFAALSSFERAASPPPPPIPEIDVSSGKFPDEVARRVIRKLKESPEIHLANITTQRAGRIAAGINAEFPDPAQRQQMTLHHTPKKDSRQTAGVRSELSLTGATVKEFSSPRTSDLQAAEFPEASSSTPRISLQRRVFQEESPSVLSETDMDKRLWDLWKELSSTKKEEFLSAGERLRGNLLVLSDATKEE